MRLAVMGVFRVAGVKDLGMFFKGRFYYIWGWGGIVSFCGDSEVWGRVRGGGRSRFVREEWRVAL